MSVLFYRWTGGTLPDAPLPEGFALEYWRPDSSASLPRNLPWRLGIVKPVLQYAILHRLGRFSNRDYAICMIRRGEVLAHISFLYPGYWRFPFMGAADLQIGDTWTHPQHRGRGLAGIAIREALKDFAASGRAFWYLCESENRASVRVIEKAGFVKVGEGALEKRLGLGILGRYLFQPGN